jgi:hypothetical protein
MKFFIHNLQIERWLYSSFTKWFFSTGLALGLAMISIVCAGPNDVPSNGIYRGEYIDFFYPEPKFGTGITIDKEGNVYFLGGPDWLSSRFTSVVSKYDKNGKKVWRRNLKVRGSSESLAKAFTVDSKGNVYVAVTTPNRKGDYICTTIKLNKNGKMLWQARYNVTPKSWFEPRAMAVDSKNNVYIAGEFMLEPGFKSSDFDILEPLREHISLSLIVKYDTNGRQLYSFSSAPEEWCEAEDIAVDETGNFYVAECLDGKELGTFKSEPNCYPLWRARWAPNREGISCISSADILRVDSGGSVYVVGDSWGTKDEYTEMVTIKYDSNGHQKWEVHYETSGNKWIFPRSMVLAEAGSIYILANESPKTKSNSFSDHSSAASDEIERMKKREFVIVKYDSGGKELWRARYKDPEGREIGSCYLAMDGKDNVYVIGSVLLEPLVIMYDANGKQQWIRQLKNESELAKFLSGLKRL